MFPEKAGSKFKEQTALSEMPIENCFENMPKILDEPSQGLNIFGGRKYAF